MGTFCTSFPNFLGRYHQSSWNSIEQKRDCAFGSLEEICACVNNRLGKLFWGGRFWYQLRHLVSKEASWNSVFAHQVTHDFKVIYVTLRWQEKSDLSFYFLTLLDDKRNLFFLFIFGHSFARNVIFFSVATLLLPLSAVVFANNL
jgi:hypothetical protein